MDIFFTVNYLWREIFINAIRKNILKKAISMVFKMDAKLLYRLQNDSKLTFD